MRNGIFFKSYRNPKRISHHKRRKHPFHRRYKQSFKNYKKKRYNCFRRRKFFVNKNRTEKDKKEPNKCVTKSDENKVDNLDIEAIIEKMKLVQL